MTAKTRNVIHLQYSGQRQVGSVAEWSARGTRSPTVPGSGPALATCWICYRSRRAQILGHACI